jgi:uncharacterized membrane protein YraQ (UPF0718 family)
MEIIINILVGIISGLFSGWVVSKYFKDKEVETEAHKQFIDDKQNMVNYLRLIKLELKMIIDELKVMGKPVDLKDINRALEVRPITESFGEDAFRPLDEKSEELLGDVIKTLSEVENYFKVKDPLLSVSDLKMFESSLTRSMIKILELKRKSM